MWKVITRTWVSWKNLFPWYQWLFYGGLFLWLAPHWLVHDTWLTLPAVVRLVLLFGTVGMLAVGSFFIVENHVITIGISRTSKKQ